MNANQAVMRAVCQVAAPPPPTKRVTMPYAVTVLALHGNALLIKLAGRQSDASPAASPALGRKPCTLAVAVHGAAPVFVFILLKHHRSC